MATTDRFDIRDSLIALPQRLLLLIACIPLLACGLGVYLIFSAASGSVRTSGVILITLCAPTLTVAVGFVAAVRVQTDDIDKLVTTWLTNTVKEKLSTYLVGVEGVPASRLHPPLFERMRVVADETSRSFCVFELIGFNGTSHFMYVKSNILNVEIGSYFVLRGVEDSVSDEPLHLADLESWSTHLDDVRVRCVADTLHGSLSEGYGVYISGGQNHDGPYVTYRLRQNLGSGFITSPYTRRYFAEDIAIATYWLHREIQGARGVVSSGSRGPLSL